MNIDLFDRKTINRFHGEYGFLSNFHLCPIEYDGIIWPSVEHRKNLSEAHKGKRRKADELGN